MQIFITHAQNDKEVARDIGEELSKAGYKVWLSEEQVLPGDNWALMIGRALEESELMIVLVSPEAARSQQVREEINFALGSPNYAGRIIPVEVRPTDEMPWVLRTMVTVQAGRSRAHLAKRIIDRIEQAPVR